MHHVVRPALAGAALLLAATAHADDVKWTFGGFGTLSAVHATEDKADYTASPISPGQAGHTKRWAADVDSRLGAQLGVQIDKRWSAVAQVVYEQGVERHYEPHLEWANVKYQATPDLALRFGRIALPLFLAADYRKASYALPWVRTPVELYGLMPISNSDGIDASYRWKAFDAKHETQVMMGVSSVDITPDAQSRTRKILGLTHTMTAGALTLRATAARAEVNIAGAEEFFDAFRSFGPTGQRLADRYDIASRNVSVLSAGASYDPGNWFLMGEIGRVNTKSLLGDQTAGYVSGGYRFGTFTPYATVARVVVNQDTDIAGLPTKGLPPQAAGLAALLNTELKARLRSISAQDSVAAGLRWDFAPNYAFKMQVERVRPRNGTNGTLTNVQPDYRSRPFSLASFSVDFVF